jgi:hypothetical protein
MITSLNCKENTNEDFIQNWSQIKGEFIFSEIFALNLENKLIKNISNSNAKEILSNKLIYNTGSSKNQLLVYVRERSRTFVNVRVF